MKKLELCKANNIIVQGISIEDCYARARLSSYRSLQEYYYDIELSEALYPVLRTLEVILRNSVWHAISASLNNTSWLVDRSVLLDQEQKIITETQEKIKRYYPLRTHENDHLISELNFGFWTNLFNARYEKILWPHCIKLLIPYIPKKYRYRKFLDQRLRKIRDLRNRIFHHQRISHMKNISVQHQEMVELIGWIQPEILNHLKEIDRFSSVYAKKLTNPNVELA